MRISTRFGHFLVGASLLLATPGQAQAPTLVSTSPVRLSTTVAPLAGISATFSQAVQGAAGLRLFGSQLRGYRAGTPSGDGTATLRLQPAQAFAPGEQLMLSIPPTVQSAGGTALGSGQVISFQAASGPATANLSYRFQDILREPNGYVLRLPAIADINNDGWLDVLVPNSGSNGVTLHLATGAGQFASPTRLLPGYSPIGIVAADFNNDGNLDLVTASNSVSLGLSLSLGLGNGTFAATTALATSIQPMAPKTGDLNGDGNLDLIYLQYTTSSYQGVGILLGNGQGSFTPGPVPTSTTPNGSNLYVADLNNDGRLDYLLSWYDAGSRFGGTKSFINTGTDFAEATGGVTIMTKNKITQLGLADLTGDGILDLVMPYYGVSTTSSAPCTFRVYPGSGQGTFNNPVLSMPAPGNVSGLVLTDFNGDGWLDLLAVGNPYTFTSGAYASLNDGTNHFPTSTTLSPGSSIDSYAVTGDLNGDGTMDAVITADMYGSSTVYFNPPLSTAPVISTVSPTTGGAGTVVTLTGTNLAGATAVLMGGFSVPFTVSATGAITFTVPTGLSHELISVVTPTGQTTVQRAGPALAVRSAATLPVSVFPNPAADHAQVQLPAGTGAVQAKLYNALGQLVRRVPLAPSPAGLAQLELTGLAPALYTLRLQAASQTSTIRLQVQ